MESKESLIPRFVESSPKIRTYSGMIDSIISELEHNLYIMGYFDQITLNRLLPAARYVRIISPSGALRNRRNKDALERMSRAGAQVRTHPMLHARIFCVPDQRFLIVGSGDLQTDCMGGTRFDVGIWYMPHKNS